MPATLVTDFKCIATSGPTVDGREIQAQWLHDMAETYDPATYTAKIWLDHMRYASYGSVRELKVEKVDGVVKLYARISPSRSLLQMNQVWEEYLHFSIEVTEDFAKTGKTYLTGLAMTDSPASLGTDEMRFSSLPGRQFTARFAGEVVPDLREAEEEERFTNFFKKLFRTFKDDDEHEETGDDPMNKEHFDAVQGSLGEMTQAVSGLVEKMDGFMTKFAQGDESGGDAGEGGEGGGEGGDTHTPEGDGKFATEILDSVKTMTDAFNTMAERMEKAAPGTFTRENHQPAGEQDSLC